MIDFNKIKDIYLATGSTDLRKSINGFSVLIQDKYQLSPFMNAMFIFCNLMSYYLGQTNYRKI
jgi:transposase